MHLPPSLERNRAAFEAVSLNSKRNIPTTTVVELTRRCNLRCVMCYATPDRARRELSREELFELIDQIRDLGSLFVTFLGGDPTVQPAFVPLVQHAAQRRLAIQILTNGLLIDPSTADALAEAGVFHVGLTLMGATAATHDALARRPGAFEGTLRAARLLKARRLHVVIKFLLMNENFVEAESMVALAESLGVPHSMNPSISPTDRLSADPWKHRLAFDTFKEAVRRYAPMPKRIPSAEGHDLTCQMGRGYMAVNAYGDVLSCITVPIPAGNVRYAPLRTIWEESPFLNKMRELDHMQDLHGCPSCTFRPTCSRCFGLAYTETGDLFGPQPGACLKAVALADEETDPVAHGPPGLSHSDSRFWVVGDILESFGLACGGS